MPKAQTEKRPYTTDYGLSKGHCKTAKGAMKAAVCYLIENAGKHCTVEGPDGAVCRVRYNGYFGMTVEAVRGRGKLRMVK